MKKCGHAEVKGILLNDPQWLEKEQQLEKCDRCRASRTRPAGSAYSHMMKTGDFDEQEKLVAKRVDQRIAELPDGTRLRITPEGQKTVDQLVSDGDIIRTSYGTGGKVVDVGRFSVYELPWYSITYVEPDAVRNLQGNYPKTAFCWINECVAQDGRIRMLFESNVDEVVIVKKHVKGLLLKAIREEAQRHRSQEPQVEVAIPAFSLREYVAAKKKQT